MAIVVIAISIHSLLLKTKTFDNTEFTYTHYNNYIIFKPGPILKIVQSKDKKTINNHFKSFNCKSSQLKICLLFCQTSKKGCMAQMKNKADWAETTENYFSCGLILTLKITLYYKHCVSGSHSLLRNRPISIIYGGMSNNGIGGNALRGTSTCVLHYMCLHFDISNLQCLPFQKWQMREKLSPLEEKQEFEGTDVEGVRATCVCKYRERCTDSAGTQL